MGKTGADRGLDGRVCCAKTAHGSVSVQAGDTIGVSMIRDQKGVVERDRAQMGVVRTPTPPTRPIQVEAARAGLCAVDGFAPVPRLRIVTVGDAMRLRDRAVNLPARRDDTFRKAPRARRTGARRGRSTCNPRPLRCAPSIPGGGRASARPGGQSPPPRP
jgi:site-specific DNA-methyltransferase (adenine-specific)